jgi:large subunit ribosomal protein L35
MKTHKGTAKRFRMTRTGKIIRGKAFKSHLKERKSPQQKRNTRQSTLVADSDKKVIARNLGMR